jgi:hypothetical protein
MLTIGRGVLGEVAACPAAIDGQRLTLARRGRQMCLVKKNDVWEDAGAAPDFVQAPDGSWDPVRGPFKNALTHRFVLVRATHGTPDENAWALARSRFDAEQWWYRGNGHVEIVTDDAFLRSLAAGVVSTNAILYGNNDSNAAARELCQNQAVRVSRGEAWIGTRKLTGEDLGVLAVGTFKSAQGRRVYGLVSGTGLVGLRSTDRIPYILAGTGVPDVCVVRASVWSKAIGGVECAGFLDQNLLAARPDLAWRTPEPAK